jgi:mannan endo-1,4-beta-mannosidase
MKKTCCILLALILVSACVANAGQEPANPNANARAKAILQYFQSLEGRTNKCLLSGQFSRFGWNTNADLMKEIHDKTGHWPAFLGVDYAGRGGVAVEAPNKAVLEYWKQGGLVTVSTHLYNPARTNLFLNQFTNRSANPPTNYNNGLRDTNVDLNTLLATNTETHIRWMHELDQIADGLQQLQTNGVVVLWRPFHEMNGNWFWWDGKDPETFKKLWRQEFDYFTKTKGLNNLLWVYAPNHGTNTAVYYPGDHYVDLVGLDAYTDFVDTNHILGYAEVARLPKPFGFTEFGPHSPSNPPGDYDYRRFLEGVQKNFPRTVFFMSWNDKWSLASNTNVTEMLSDPKIVNREDVPKGLAGNQ